MFRLQPQRGSCCRRATCCPVAASPSPLSRGASGLDVEGFRPTSPKAWAIVTKALQQGKVCGFVIVDHTWLLHDRNIITTGGMHSMGLSAVQVKLISGSEAKLQADRGIPVIDIRPPPEYEGSHIPKSVNIPLYRPITGVFSVQIMLVKKGSVSGHMAEA